MKKVLIARPLPDVVVVEARKYFDVTVRSETSPLSMSEMQTALGAFDGIMPTLGDMFQPAVFDSLSESKCSILANFGVGYNHIDVDAALQRNRK